MVLVGNKIDVANREVDEGECLKLAKEFKCEYIECSAKNNINI